MADPEQEIVIEKMYEITLATADGSEQIWLGEFDFARAVNWLRKFTGIQQNHLILSLKTLDIGDERIFRYQGQGIAHHGWLGLRVEAVAVEHENIDENEPLDEEPDPEPEQDDPFDGIFGKLIDDREGKLWRKTGEVRFPRQGEFFVYQGKDRVLKANFDFERDKQALVERVYKKADGTRWVETGEFRIPRQGDYYEFNDYAQQAAEDHDSFDPKRKILKPLAALEIGK